MAHPLKQTGPSTFSWVDPTLNTDGSPVAAGEITGYQIGIRSTANSNVGVYSIFAVVSGANAVSESFSALGTTLAPDNYSAAIQTLSTENGNSVFSPEVTFTVVSSAPPNPPTNFTVA